jgi:hypothetical protein
MKFFIITLLIIVTSCNQKKEAHSAALSFDTLFGKILLCEFDQIKTKLFFHSPHVISVPIKEAGYEMEYFHSVGSKLETNSLYFESSFKGKSNFQTTQTNRSESVRRLKVTIKDENLYITAISKIDENNIPIKPVLYECKSKGIIKFD